LKAVGSYCSHERGRFPLVCTYILHNTYYQTLPVVGVDAYCATVFANPDAVYADLTELLTAAGMGPRQVTGEKVPYYARNLLLLAPTGHRLAQVRAGGSNPHPFVECKGPASPLVCGFLRASYDHRPSRMDAALDQRAAGLFRRFLRLAKRTAKKYGLRMELAGDWNTTDAGRTIYLGSRQSQVFLRIYEKGLKYAHELGLPVTDELREWIRVEVEFKPQNRKSKMIARSIEPAAIWGMAEWLAHFAQEAFAMQADRININQRRESNRDRALRFMASQYRSHLLSLLDDCERDDARFGAAIREIAGLSGEEAQQAA
jgi:hypothetical protein